MSEEITQPASEPTQPQPSPSPSLEASANQGDATAGNAEPISTSPIENPVSEPNPVPVSPDEPTAGAPIPSVDSMTSEVPSEASQASPGPESAVMDKDDNQGNEPLEQPAQPSLEATASEAEPEKTAQNKDENRSDRTDGTNNQPVPIAPEPITAQIPVFEPLVVNKQKELWAKFLYKIQTGKRKKLDRVMTLFAERAKITNDEVEKLLHISDATATRYLETLEKEGKIKRIGKTGKYTHYEKI